MALSQSLPPAPAPEQVAALPGFGPGVQLMTPEGELPVEWLATGDRLITRDHGAQPIVWLGRTRIGRERLRHLPGLAPVEISRDALGPGFPTHPTRLAPHARVLLSGAEVALHAGTDEALAEIGALTDGERIDTSPCIEGTCYTFALLPMHCLVQANGLWAETLLLDRATTEALGGALPEAVARDPELGTGHARTARLCLSGWEIVAMRGRGAQGLPNLIRRVA